MNAADIRTLCVAHVSTRRLVCLPLLRRLPPRGERVRFCLADHDSPTGKWSAVYPRKSGGVVVVAAFDPEQLIAWIDARCGVAAA